MKKIITLLTMVFCLGAIAQQDTILKLNGSKIICKIIEVGANAVSYKKAANVDGPTYTEYKNDIAYIIFKNGQVEEFDKLASKESSTVANPSTSNSNNKNSNNNTCRFSDEYKIILDGKHYYMQGKRMKNRDVNCLLSHSSNTAVQAPLKAAKLIKTINIITTIISYPSTITGGVATIATARNLFFDSKNGTLKPSAWVNAGLSFVGTLSFPIAAKILKKKQKKLYAKTIDTYNADKK